MRIAGKRVETDDVVEVLNPYNNAVVGTVPAARPEHVREAFAKAQGLQAEADPLRAPADPAAHRRDCCATAREEFARLITAESGLCWKDSLYEASRAYDVWSFAAQLTIKDDGEIYSCDITPERQGAQDLHHAPAAARRHLGDHALQPSAQHGEPQARAGDRDQQPRRAEADRADAADRAGARRRALRGRPAAGDAVGRDRQSLDHGRRHDHRSGRRPHHLHGLGAGRQAHRRRRPATSASCSSSAATIR